MEFILAHPKVVFCLLFFSFLFLRGPSPQAFLCSHVGGCSSHSQLKTHNLLAGKGCDLPPMESAKKTRHLSGANDGESHGGGEQARGVWSGLRWLVIHILRNLGGWDKRGQTDRPPTEAASDGAEQGTHHFGPCTLHLGICCRSIAETHLQRTEARSSGKSLAQPPGGH